MEKIKTIYDLGSAATPAQQSGIGLNEQPHWMTNTTPKAQLASVGVAMVQLHPDIAPKDVRIPNNWLKK